MRAGNLYALTGNGSFNGDTGGRNFGNSFIKVSPAGTLLDWFTPYNWSFLNSTDEDLGIQNALLIPGTNLVVGGGKEGVMYVVDRTNMGHFRSGNNGQIVQSFQASSAARMNGAPVYWSSPTYGPAIYVWPAGDPLKVFRLVGGLFTTPASAQSTALAAGGMPGGMLSLSANGSTAGTGILWAALSNAGDANHTPRPGILRAYDASNVTRELWNSQQNAAQGRARQLLEVQSADGGERQGLRRVAVEQAGRVWIDRSVERQHRAGRQRRHRPEPAGAGHGDAVRLRDRRRQSGPAGTAHDDVEPGQRAGGRDVRDAGRALDDRDIPGAGHLCASASARSTVRSRRATT